jgi:hypothetical protein
MASAEVMKKSRKHIFSEPIFAFGQARYRFFEFLVVFLHDDAL